MPLVWNAMHPDCPTVKMIEYDQHVFILMHKHPESREILSKIEEDLIRNKRKVVNYKKKPEFTWHTRDLKALKRSKLIARRTDSWLAEHFGTTKEDVRAEVKRIIVNEAVRDSGIYLSVVVKQRVVK